MRGSKKAGQAINRIIATVHPPPQSARSSHFSPFCHLWPSQNCKTTNNITTLTWCTTEPVTTVCGLITAWSSSSDYQGHRLNALADFGVGLCARPAKIWIWSSQHMRADGGVQCVRVTIGMAVAVDH